MTDIFSDTILTAPPRKSSVVITGFMAHTAAEVKTMAQNMKAIATAENAAMRDRMGHRTSTYDRAKMPQSSVAKNNDDNVLNALTSLGPSTADEIALAVNLNRSTVSARLKLLFEKGAVKRSRLRATGTRYLYRVAQAKQSAYKGENVGVASYHSGVQA